MTIPLLWGPEKCSWDDAVGPLSLGTSLSRLHPPGQTTKYITNPTQSPDPGRRNSYLSSRQWDLIPTNEWMHSKKKLAFMRSENEALCTSKGVLKWELESSAWPHWLYKVCTAEKSCMGQGIPYWLNTHYPWRLSSSRSIVVLGSRSASLSV